MDSIKNVCPRSALTASVSKFSERGACGKRGAQGVTELPCRAGIEAQTQRAVSQWQDPLGRAGARLAEVLEELGLRRLPGSGMMLPDLSDLWAHLESTSRLLSAHGCPGEPQGQGAEIVACEMMRTLMHSRQYLKDATPLAAPKNEATLPERWPEAGLQEARLFSRRMHRLLRCPGNC
ncbi:hypothetical protein R6Z07F_015992 [Ovis aries]